MISNPPNIAFGIKSYSGTFSFIWATDFLVQ
jgi:hypothetical protein